MDKEKFIQIIADFLETSDIADTDELSVLGLDSLRIVELIVYLEDELNITFDDADLIPSNFETVNDLYYCIQKYFDR